MNLKKLFTRRNQEKSSIFGCRHIKVFPKLSKIFVLCFLRYISVFTCSPRIVLRSMHIFPPGWSWKRTAREIGIFFASWLSKVDFLLQNFETFLPFYRFKDFKESWDLHCASDYHSFALERMGNFQFCMDNSIDVVGLLGFKIYKNL